MMANSAPVDWLLEDGVVVDHPEVALGSLDGDGSVAVHNTIVRTTLPEGERNAVDAQPVAADAAEADAAAVREAATAIAMRLVEKEDEAARLTTANAALQMKLDNATARADAARAEAAAAAVAPGVGLARVAERDAMRGAAGDKAHGLS